MLTVLTQFKDDINEVEHYFRFLEKIENDYLTLNDPNGNSFAIGLDLSRILKANAFLIIYNLIEATIKNALWEMFEMIKTDRTTYENLIKEIQLLWIQHQIKLEFRTKDETVNEQILKVVNKVLTNSIDYYKSKQHLKFDAGSLDINGINATLKRHGLQNIPAHELIVESFKTTKANRNKLAHGDSTFIDCGKDYTFRDLRIIKCHVIRYLLKSLFSIKDFIDNKTYRVVLAGR